MLAGELHEGLGFIELQGGAGVELAEVDGLAGVGFGFVPVLADFEDQPRVEFEFTFPQDLEEAVDQAGAVLRGRVLPEFECVESRVDGGLDVLFGRFLMEADEFGGAGGVERADLFAGAKAMASDDEIVFAAELGADFRDGRSLGAGVFFLAEAG